MSWTTKTKAFIKPGMLPLFSPEFSHCASICPHGNGVLIAFYAGSRECSDDQCAYIMHWDGSQYRGPLCLGPKTGNVIIWAIKPDMAMVLFSFFEKDTANPVQRWMYCSNWYSIICYKSSNFSMTTPPIRLKTDPKLGFLPRCQPIKADTWLIPMYREHNCYGEIWSYDPDKHRSPFEVRGKIGVTDEESKSRFGRGILIQPTLWFDEETQRLHSLSRDITKRRKARYNWSDDYGMSWSDTISTTIDNYNNSLVAIDDRTAEPYLVWNQGQNRYSLMLGKISMASGMPSISDKIKPIQLNDRRVSNSGSYPNYCIDHDGNLHIVHSNYPHILHHILERNEV